MKKIASYSYLFLVAIFGLVACESSDLDTTVSDGVQEDRETLTIANAHYFGDVNETEGASYAISLTLLSEGMSIVSSDMAFESYSGTGYAYDIVFNSAHPTAIDTGTYVMDVEESYAAGTIHAEETYLTIVHGGSNTVTTLQDATVKVSLENDVYTIDLAATTIEGIDVVGTYVGKIAIDHIYFYLEPTDTLHISNKVDLVEYVADEDNREDWATDSVYSYYAEMYAFYAAYYAEQLEGFIGTYGPYIEMYEADTVGVYDEGAELYALYADSLANATNAADSAKYQAFVDQYQMAALLVKVYNAYSELAYYTEMFAYYAQVYAANKEAYTPADAHYITVTDDQGNVMNLEIALNALSPEYHAVLPDGQYALEGGLYYVTETADYRSSGKLYGSYLKAADGNVYYVGAGLVDVKFDGTTVKELHVKAYSVYGSEITYDYVAE